MMRFLQKYASVFLRVVLAVAFLSAVADRFGLWGAAGDPGVAWGNFESFVSYTAFLNPWSPESFVLALAWTATVFEVVFAIALLIGFKTRMFAVLSGLLIFSFGLAMAFTSGIKAPLDYSVFSAMAGAFALATFPSYAWSLDSITFRSVTLAQPAKG